MLQAPPLLFAYKEKRMTQWLEFSVEADREAVEAISELFTRYGWNQGVAIEEPILPHVDEDKYEIDLSKPVTIRTWVPADPKAEQARVAMESNLWHLGQIRYVSPLKVEVKEEEDWNNAWKEHFHVLRIGQHMVIQPSWREHSSEPGDHVIVLDPGSAFGTGLHQTTRLCLAALEDYVRGGMRVLDLGTGSGVLAIGAARLGAGAVLAVDIDDVAVRATRENMALNPAVAPLITAAPGTIENVKGESFDLIVANIIARVIIEVAASLAAALKPDGLLIASGIIAERADEVAIALAAAGFHHYERRQEGDWVALVAGLKERHP